MKSPLLQQLGFSRKESDIYLLLLQQGRLSAADISTQTGISRPTVYSVAKTLMQKGIVAEDLGGPARTFVAKPPEDLVILANREEKQLQKKKQVIAQVSEELKSIALNPTHHVPKIVYITEDEIEEYGYKQSPVWDASIMERDGIYWGFQDVMFPQKFEKWIDWYWKRAPKGLKLQLLSNASEVDQRLRPKYTRRLIRPWAQAGHFTATTWVMGDYVVLLNIRSRPHSLIEIYDKAFAENFRQIFKAIWDTLGR